MNVKYVKYADESDDAKTTTTSRVFITYAVINGSITNRTEYRRNGKNELMETLYQGSR